MNSRTRRARRILRSARRGPWGNGRNALLNAMQPVYGTDGEVRHYKLVTDPWYTVRNGDYYKPGSWRPDDLTKYLMDIDHTNGGGPKSRQRWLKDHEKSARWDVGHALSDCCGWGNDEYTREPYPFVSGSVPPRPALLPYPDEKTEDKEEK